MDEKFPITDTIKMAEFTNGCKNNLPEIYVEGPKGEVQSYQIAALKTRKADSKVEFAIYAGSTFKAGVCFVNKPLLGLVKLQGGWAVGAVDFAELALIWDKAAKDYAALHNASADFYVNFPKKVEGDAAGWTIQEAAEGMKSVRTLELGQEFPESQIAYFRLKK